MVKNQKKLTVSGSSHKSTVAIISKPKMQIVYQHFLEDICIFGTNYAVNIVPK